MKLIFLKGDLKSVRRNDEGGWTEVNKKRDDCPTNFSSAPTFTRTNLSRVFDEKKERGSWRELIARTGTSVSQLNNGETEWDVYVR